MRKLMFYFLILVLVCPATFSCSSVKEVENNTANTAQFDTLDLEPEYDADAALTINFDEKNVPDNANGTVSEDNENVILKSGGIYLLKGTLKDKRVKVEEGLGERIEIVLDGFNYDGNKDCVIYSPDKKCRVLIFLADGSENVISLNTSNNTNESVSENAAIFARGDLSFNGKGKLSINTEFESCIECKNDLAFVDGNYIFNTKNKGIKTNDKLLIRDGSFNIDSKGESISGKAIDIMGGTIKLKSGDDAINATDKDQNKKENQKGVYINISGGDIDIDAAMDGIDSNGDLSLEGGTLVISGADNDNERIIDYNGSISLGNTPGINMIGVGPGAKMQDFGDNPNQNYIVMYFDEQQGAMQTIEVTDESGNMILSFEPQKSYKAALITSPKLIEGKIYTVSCFSDPYRKGEEKKDYKVELVKGRNVVSMK